MIIINSQTQYDTHLQLKLQISFHIIVYLLKSSSYAGMIQTCQIVWGSAAAHLQRSVHPDGFRNEKNKTQWVKELPGIVESFAKTSTLHGIVYQGK